MRRIGASSPEQECPQEPKRPELPTPGPALAPGAAATVVSPPVSSR